MGLINTRPYAQSGPDVSKRGLIAGGYAPAIVAVIDKYLFADDSVSVTASMGQTRSDLTGGANTDTGILSGGRDGGSTHYTYQDEYTFADNSIIQGTSLPFTLHSSKAGLGNATRLIIAGGNDGTVTWNSFVDKYTYATEIHSTLTSILSHGVISSAAFGHTTFGFVVGGSSDTNGGSSVTSDKYTYATDTTQGAQALSIGRQQHCAASSSTKGLVMGGSATANRQSVEVYTFATDSYVSGATLSTSFKFVTAFGDDTAAVVSGGHDGSAVIATTNKHLYASNTLTVEDSLTVARGFHGSCSNAHGGL